MTENISESTRKVIRSSETAVEVDKSQLEIGKTQKLVETSGVCGAI
jgi:hypothetical protein